MLLIFSFFFSWVIVWWNEFRKHYFFEKESFFFSKKGITLQYGVAVGMIPIEAYYFVILLNCGGGNYYRITLLIFEENKASGGRWNHNNPWKKKTRNFNTKLKIIFFSRYDDFVLCARDLSRNEVNTVYDGGVKNRSQF